MLLTTVGLPNRDSQHSGLHLQLESKWNGCQYLGCCFWNAQRTGIQNERQSERHEFRYNRVVLIFIYRQFYVKAWSFFSFQEYRWFFQMYKTKLLFNGTFSQSRFTVCREMAVGRKERIGAAGSRQLVGEWGRTTQLVVLRRKEGERNRVKDHIMEIWKI